MLIRNPQNIDKISPYWGGHVHPKAKSADLANVLFQGFSTQWFRAWSISAGSKGTKKEERRKEGRREGREGRREEGKGEGAEEERLLQKTV